MVLVFLVKSLHSSSRIMAFSTWSRPLTIPPLMALLNGLYRDSSTDGDLRDWLSRFLAHYWTTPDPHTTTGVCPAELLLGRRPHTRLDLLRPSVSTRVDHKQLQQKQARDDKAWVWNFSVGERIYTWQYGRGAKNWVPGQIIEQMGSVSFRVELSDGTVFQGHQDQIRKTAWSSVYSTRANNGRTTSSWHFSASCHCNTSRTAKIRWTTKSQPTEAWLHRTFSSTSYWGWRGSNNQALPSKRQTATWSSNLWLIREKMS